MIVVVVVVFDVVFVVVDVVVVVGVDVVVVDVDVVVVDVVVDVVVVVVDIVVVVDVVADVVVVFGVVVVFDVVVDVQPTLLPSPCRLYAFLSHSRRLSHCLLLLHRFCCFGRLRLACWDRLVSLSIGQLLSLW